MSISKPKFQLGDFVVKVTTGLGVLNIHAGCIGIVIEINKVNYPNYPTCKVRWITHKTEEDLKPCYATGHYYDFQLKRFFPQDKKK